VPAVPRSDAVGENLLDTGAPFYEVYRTKDNKFLSVYVPRCVPCCPLLSLCMCLLACVRARLLSSTARCPSLSTVVSVLLTRTVTRLGHVSWLCFLPRCCGLPVSGAIEPQFYKLLIQGMGLVDAGLPFQNDDSKWPEMKVLFAAKFAEKTQDEWMAIFRDSDACVAPVLTSSEFLTHPHTVARQNVIPRADDPRTCVHRCGQLAARLQSSPTVPASRQSSGFPVLGMQMVLLLRSRQHPSYHVHLVFPSQGEVPTSVNTLQRS
jgi:hypothetical protein